VSILLFMIVFMIGAGLALVGSLKIGTYEIKGTRVRVAGVVLCLPFIISRLLYVLAVSLFGDSLSLAGFFAFLELIGIAVASSVSYWLLMLDYQLLDRKTQHPDFTPKKPTPSKPSQTKSQTPTPAPIEKPKTFAKKNDYPNVMNTTEAANYLNITEDALIELIEAGKIAASFINYRYHISRIVLDEFTQAKD
jgi:excisionase family DNA binding protein